MVYARSLALVLTLFGAVSALPATPFVPESDMEFADIVARKAAPAGWETWGFEDYNVYHDRYNALDCKHKHDTTFFSQCCGPLRKGKTLASRPAQCNPANVNSTATTISTSAAPTSTVITTDTEVDDEEDDDDDCEEDDETEDDGDDDEDEPVTSAVAATSATAATSTSKTSATASKTSTAAQASTTGTVYKGGYATFYSQGGNAGACGKVNSDDALIGAIDHERWGKSSYGIKSDLCGSKVKITNTKNNKSVTIVIADVCPSCKNKNSIDLSIGAFTQIATKSEGMVPIEWSFV